MGDNRANTASVWRSVTGAAEQRVRNWEAAANASEDPLRGDRGSLLGDLAASPDSLDFTRRLIDSLFGPSDAFTAAVGLRGVSKSELPERMPTRDRLLLRAGGVASLGLPWVVRPAARKNLLSRMPDVLLELKLSGRLTALTETLRTYRERGHSVLVSLHGDPVYGAAGGEAEVQRLLTLAAQPAVRELAFDPARLVPGATEWSIESDLTLAVTRVRPILEAALEHGVRLVIEPRDTVWAKQLTEFLTRAFGCSELDRLSIGVRLFAELPESWESYAAIHRFAHRRVADGGAPVEAVIGLSDVAAAERVASIHSGLPVPVIEDAPERVAQLLRLVEVALQPSRASVLRPVIATEDPLIAAAVIEAAARLGSDKLYALQLRCGLATELAAQLVGDATDATPDVRLRLPVTPKGEYGEVVGYLVGLLAEAAASEPSQVSPSAFAEAAERAIQPAPASHRQQQRAREWDPSERDSALFYRAPDEPATFDTGGLTAAVLGLARDATGEVVLEEVAPTHAIPVVSRTGFANEPPTDGSLPANREWARGLLRRAHEIAMRDDRLDETVALTQADLDPEAAVSAAREAAQRWSDLRHEGRAVRLRRVALATAAARDRLITELAASTGAPFTELDAAVNLVIDSARYAGQLADGLRVVRGATFVPDRLVLVVGDADAPLATQAAAVLAVLGSGAGVLWAVSPGTLTAAAACVEEWEVGGLTQGAVGTVSVTGGDAFAALGASPHVDRAVVLGNRSLGRELARRRPDLRVEGHFTARGSIIVTPSAERERAIADIIDSAFRGSQTALGSTNAVILLSSVARSRGFRAALAEAVRNLRVGDSTRPMGEDPLTFDVGPLPQPPSQAGLAALTELGHGEEWLVQPQQLDDEGRLWTPGVRLGVSPGSPFWDDARGLPLIGLGSAQLLGEAVAQQNAAGSGAVAGIQSWDSGEVASWLAGIEAAALSVNRATGAARVERQPFGGWNDAIMGLPALSGGPHWLVAQGSWERRPGQRSDTLHLRGLAPEVVLLIEAAQPALAYEEFDELRRAALADQLTWQTDLGAIEDGIGLGIERNALRTAPVTVHVRLAEDGSLGELMRVLAAALLVRSPVAVSTGTVLPPGVSELLTSQGIDVSLERDDAWLERLAAEGPTGPRGSVATRVRLIGGDRVRVAEWMGGLDRAALWAEPVTMAGPVELLTLLREQSISVRAERHGLAEFAPGLDALLE
ncbi:MAG: aldehyde dehydrogenase family protein [Leucobacter sp.]|nr:aldehyde dehydrogenase family protein [Leucobacter sp.]